MNWWNGLFKSPARRKAEQDMKRRQALAKAKTALRKERRAIAKRQVKAGQLRRGAVDHEKQGNSALAKQLVKQFVQLDKEGVARALALSNMEYALEQVQVKDNYDEFVRGMKVVADIEDLVRQSVDPEVTRERLTDLAQRNQDLVEPWLDSLTIETPEGTHSAPLTEEEQEAYRQVMGDAVGEIEAAVHSPDNAEFAQMDRELEQKMDAALGKA